MRRYSLPSPWGRYLEPGLYIGGFAPCLCTGQGVISTISEPYTVSPWQASVVFAAPFTLVLLSPDIDVGLNTRLKFHGSYRSRLINRVKCLLWAHYWQENFGNCSILVELGFLQRTIHHRRHSPPFPCNQPPSLHRLLAKRNTHKLSFGFTYNNTIL